MPMVGSKTQYRRCFFNCFIKGTQALQSTSMRAIFTKSSPSKQVPVQSQ